MSPWRSPHNRFGRLRKAILTWLFPLAGTVFLLAAGIIAAIKALNG